MIIKKPEKTIKITDKPVARTLPREIIKWIQGLDLSFSLKDYKKDLINGFLIAEIFSRFYPGKLQLHSFQNSMKYERRKNNWQLLQVFFRKYSIGINKNEWKLILDQQSCEQLYQFINRIYALLTKRKLQKPPLSNYVNSPDYLAKPDKQKHGTASYLLKEKGLQKLQNLNMAKKNMQDSIVNENQQEKKKFVQPHHQTKKTNYLRVTFIDKVPSKPISPTIQNMNYQIDVKNVNIKQSTQKAIFKDQMQETKKDNKQTETDKNFSFVSFSNQMQKQNKKKINEKTIFDHLNQMIQNILEDPTFSQDAQKLQSKNLSKYCDILPQNIETLNDQFTATFIGQVFQSRKVIFDTIFKDQHQIWKFFSFFFKCLHFTQFNTLSFVKVINLIKEAGQSCLINDPVRTRYLFIEFFMPSIVIQIKNCIYFQKKSELIKLIYAFCLQDSISKKNMVFQLKVQLNDINYFMQALAVLVSFQDSFNQKNQNLHQDFLYYAHRYLLSNSTNLRTMALRILSHQSQIDHNLVQQMFQKYIKNVSKFRWWQNRCQVIIILCNIIKGIIKTSDYQKYVKNVNFHNLMSLQNQKIANGIKETIQKLSEGIIQSCSHDQNQIIIKITFLNMLTIISQSKILMQFFISLFLQSNALIRDWVLYSQKEQYLDQPQQEYIFLNDKSFKYNVSIDSSSLKSNTAQILLQLVQLIKQYKLQIISPQYMDLILFCFKHTDFKIMNMESCQNIANIIKELIYLSLCNQDLCKDGKFVLQKMLSLYFYSDIKIQDSQQLLSSVICLIYQQNKSQCIKIIEQIMQNIVNEGYKNNIQIIKKFVNDVYSGIKQRQGGESFIRNTNLKNIFKALQTQQQRVDNIERSYNVSQDEQQVTYKINE